VEQKAVLASQVIQQCVYGREMEKNLDQATSDHHVMRMMIVTVVVDRIKPIATTLSVMTMLEPAQVFP
jgi:hypothetical protein